MASSSSSSGGGSSPRGEEAGSSCPPLHRPRLVVFDLDATLWYPELFMMSGRPYRRLENGRIVDRSGTTISLFPDAQAVLEELATHEAWRGVKFGLASRTDCVEDAFALMKLIQVTPDLTMDKLFHYKEIFPGNKKKHFANLRASSGIAYSDMVFFDDWDMNCRDVSQYGVACHVVPSGLTLAKWRRALQHFHDTRGPASGMGGGADDGGEEGQHKGKKGSKKR